MYALTKIIIIGGDVRLLYKLTYEEKNNSPHSKSYYNPTS